MTARLLPSAWIGSATAAEMPSLRTLWNVRATAPYFHNNAAKSLEEVIEHYAFFFPFATPIVLPGAPPIVFSEQDKADLLAYLKLL